jgi:hypothetical protein
MQRSQPATRWSRIKTMVAIGFALGCAACAPLETKSTLRLTGCSPISTDHPDRQLVESDIAAFLNTVPEARAALFEVQACSMDGQLADGKTIILSSRLARLPQPQRYFIIAHEFGHYQLGHHARLGGLLAHMNESSPTTQRLGATDMSHRAEFEADAYAVQIMKTQGLDPEEAARLFDSLGVGHDNATHPAFARRAQAIRDVIHQARLGPSNTAH